MINKPDYKKITQVLNYIAEKEGGQVNYMKALKLLYLADRLHLRKYGRLITDDKLVAMKMGTLGSQARDIVQGNINLPHNVYEYVEKKLTRGQGKFIIGSNYSGKESLSETDLECIDKVISVLGNMPEFDLVELTHNLPEWKRHAFAIKKGEKRVVKLKPLDLFESTDDPVLSKIYSQTDEELAMTREVFEESLTT
ncbi:MAG: Panacea domain-containing protein [Patescibacteria group bacterium]